MVRTVFRALTLVLGSLLAALLGLEVVFRFLPVQEGQNAQPVTAADPYFHFAANRDSLWSSDSLFSIVNRVHANNYGYINDQDYDPNATTPLLAVIGDSYVEALMVPYAQTLQGRLAALAGDRGRVYSFAASGAGFAQHLAWAQFARDTFHPKAFIIVIISNDFNESVAAEGRLRGFHQFVEGADGTLQLERNDYIPSRSREIARHSALLRYYFLNMRGLGTLRQFIQAHEGGAQDYVANMRATVSSEQVARYEKAVDAFLKMLPSATGVSPDKALLVFDGFRPNMYENTMDQVKGSMWDIMRTYFMDQARAASVRVLDMDVVFREDFAALGERFEFPTNNHWSGVGHAAAARAVADLDFFREVFP